MTLVKVFDSCHNTVCIDIIFANYTIKKSRQLIKQRVSPCFSFILSCVNNLRPLTNSIGKRHYNMSEGIRFFKQK